MPAHRLVGLALSFVPCCWSRRLAIDWLARTCPGVSYKEVPRVKNIQGDGLRETLASSEAVRALLSILPCGSCTCMLNAFGGAVSSPVIVASRDNASGDPPHRRIVYVPYTCTSIYIYIYDIYTEAGGACALGACPFGLKSAVFAMTLLLMA